MDADEIDLNIVERALQRLAVSEPQLFIKVKEDGSSNPKNDHDQLKAEALERMGIKKA
jgi:hypothetical protein